MYFSKIYCVVDLLTLHFSEIYCVVDLLTLYSSKIYCVVDLLTLHFSEIYCVVDLLTLYFSEIYCVVDLLTLYFSLYSAKMPAQSASMVTLRKCAGHSKATTLKSHQGQIVTNKKEHSEDSLSLKHGFLPVCHYQHLEMPS